MNLSNTAQLPGQIVNSIRSLGGTDIEAQTNAAIERGDAEPVRTPEQLDAIAEWSQRIPARTSVLPIERRTRLTPLHPIARLFLSNAAHARSLERSFNLA